jgi:hypothetical protein
VTAFRDISKRAIPTDFETEPAGHDRYRANMDCHCVDGMDEIMPAGILRITGTGIEKRP